MTKGAHEPVPSPNQVLVLMAGFGLVVGLLLGSFAVITGEWLVALIPVLVFVNRFVLLGARATDMNRASWAWPVVSIAVASVVVAAVPDPAVPAVVIAAVVLLPVLLVLTAVVDARAAGTVWRH